MKDPEPPRKATGGQSQRSRGTFLFRLLVVLWLLYLTIHTHDLAKTTERAKEVGIGLVDATQQFFVTVKDLISGDKEGESEE